MPDWHVTAVNIAAQSGNAIHDDQAARALGYDRALVAGVTTYGYLVRQVVASLGKRWLSGGTLEVRLRQPVYEGDRLTVSAELHPFESVHVKASRDADTVDVARGEAVVDAPGPLPARDHPPMPPAAPLQPTRAALSTVVALPSVEFTIDEAWQAKLLADIGNDLPVFAEFGYVHPVVYCDLANISLMNAVALGPWIHARSRVRHHRALRVGETVSVRPRIEELSTANGAEMLTLDTAVVVDELLVARIEHALIYSISPHPS